MDDDGRVVEEHGREAGLTDPAAFPSCHQLVKEIRGVRESTELSGLGRYCFGVWGSCLAKVWIDGAVELAVRSAVLEGVAKVRQRCYLGSDQLH